MEIKSITYGQSCFGYILEVNDVDYEDMSEEQQLEIILLAAKENYNRKNIFMKALEILSADYESEYKSSYCEQCGTVESLTKVNLIDE